MRKILLKLKSIILAEREIICVSNGSIVSKKIGALFLSWNILLVIWTSFATIKFFELRANVALKEHKITELQANKIKLMSDVILLEKSVGNIKNFIFALNKYDRFAGIDEAALLKDNDIKNSNNVEVVLDRVKKDMKNVNLALLNRINGLEQIRENLNLNKNIQQVNFEELVNIANFSSDNNNITDSMVLKKVMDKNIAYLNNLEDFINAVPFSEPLDAHYTSSTFGTRLDPFTKTPRTHHGVDLVGSYMAKIHAPADGKVIFVGDKGGYGKAVILEHGYNIKTVYAHLHSYNVKVGDNVKRGQVIAIQGNTGRSTGQHLHYEILRGNDRFDPLEFVRVGSRFY